MLYRKTTYNCDKFLSFEGLVPVAERDEVLMIESCSCNLFGSNILINYWFRLSSIQVIEGKHSAYVRAHVCGQHFESWPMHAVYLRFYGFTPFFQPNLETALWTNTRTRSVIPYRFIIITSSYFYRVGLYIRVWRLNFPRDRLHVGQELVGLLIYWMRIYLLLPTVIRK
jgi:hypothetical protein